MGPMSTTEPHFLVTVFQRTVCLRLTAALCRLTAVAVSADDGTSAGGVVGVGADSAAGGAGSAAGRYLALGHSSRFIRAEEESSEVRRQFSKYTSDRINNKTEKLAKSLLLIAYSLCFRWLGQVVQTKFT